MGDKGMNKEREKDSERQWGLRPLSPSEHGDHIQVYEVRDKRARELLLI